MKPGAWLLIAAGVLILGMGGRVTYSYYKQRGIRNNNPGNIRHGESWQGMAAQQTDPAFVQFIDPKWGLRALAKVLTSYQTKYGLKTVRSIIARYAPSSENDTAAYAAAVAGALGVGLDDPINVAQMLPRLLPAIVQHENGVQPYPPQLIAQGITAAGFAVA